MKKHSMFFLFTFVVTDIFCQAQNPVLWGTTRMGGSKGRNNGAIFSYNIAKATDTVLYYFNLFESYFHDGSLMQASDGLLYGTCEVTGSNYAGVIFSYDISRDTETVLHNFGNGTGRYPYGRLFQASDGLLYGLTRDGGRNDKGLLYSFNIATGEEKDLHGFGTGDDGYSPGGSIIQSRDGLLYGGTGLGGIYDRGTIFSYNISTHTENVVYNFGFSNDDGFGGGSALLQASDGLLYGVSNAGGADSEGTLYSFDINSGAKTNLYSFGSDSSALTNPIGALIQASNGLLYGFANQGGKYGRNGGGIFSYDIATGKETDLYDFGSETDGYWPFSSLFEASDGLLYGSTGLGGPNEAGTMFSFDISSNKESVVHNFDYNIDGGPSDGYLIEVDSPTITHVHQIANNIDNIQLYPNPSSANIHLSVKLQREQLVTLNIYNTLGQPVWGKDLGKAKHIETTIPTTNLANGVYILKVNSGGVLGQKEVVIEK